MRIILLGAALLLTIHGAFAQTAAAPVQVKDSRFTMLTSFLPIDNDKQTTFLIALAKYNNVDGRSGYALLLENHVADFRYDLIDTVGLILQMNTYVDRKSEKSSWLEESSFELKQMTVMPTSNTKGLLLAFPLKDDEIHDLKKEFVKEFVFRNEVYLKDKGYWSRSKRDWRVNDPARSIFMKNALKIATVKGSFDDVSRFKGNKIPFYSLMYKSAEVIAQKLGEPVETKVDGRNTPQNPEMTYETPNGRYKISYKNGRANDIVFQPKFKLKYSKDSFYTRANGYPFELTGCDCGESILEQHDDYIRYVFRDKSYHNITFTRSDKDRVWGRFLESVRVSD